MQITARSGIECWFDVDGIVVRYWASAWTGREIVSVVEGETERVVSDKRSFGFHTPHDFDVAGHRYRLELQMKLGSAELRLFRDGELIDSDLYADETIRLDPATGRLDWHFALRKLFVPMLAGLVVGLGFGYLVGGLLK
ncbi:hypothetical protein [Wenzhouxiangella limi]|uniref:Uncharacterized protein n=1 Tax=Wenzhouxiangella limi TaxID=2707351 RepID=A0A845UTF4_9GAMM|nr:hypothetical protein [Wenzhouxiangella limi]NDY95103.1 hypothetical protein [Wenzhouxiangella limi]